MDEEDRKLVGIIGAGRLGVAVARTGLRAGRDVVIANSRGPDSLTSVVSMLGERATAGTVEQAAAAGIVVIAVPWSRVSDAVRGLAWNGQIVIDATNDFDGTDLDGRTSSEVVAGLAPGARRPRSMSSRLGRCRRSRSWRRSRSGRSTRVPERRRRRVTTARL